MKDEDRYPSSFIKWKSGSCFEPIPKKLQRPTLRVRISRPNSTETTLATAPSRFLSRFPVVGLFDSHSVRFLRWKARSRVSPPPPSAIRCTRGGTACCGDFDSVVQVLGVGAVVVLHGLRDAPETIRWELGSFLIAGMVFLSLSVILRRRWTLARESFVRENRVSLLVSIAWVVGMALAVLFGPTLTMLDDRHLRFDAFTLVSEMAIVVRGIAGTIVVIRHATAGATDPAVILVASFVVLISIGTALLMLPARRPRQPRNFPTSPLPFWWRMFTSTSASCVTGLIVVPTGTYWTPFGQTVIFCLFQVGGLGIMTCGAFFALAAGGGMQFRESATLRDMLESEQLGDVRRMLLSILVFTLASELVGAVLISGLWADLPFGERVRYSLFHSVSAFCNAGFALTDDSFVGMGNRWQVWGGVAGLIIVGGMGFAVLYNFALCLRLAAVVDEDQAAVSSAANPGPLVAVDEAGVGDHAVPAARGNGRLLCSGGRGKTGSSRRRADPCRGGLVSIGHFSHGGLQHGRSRSIAPVHEAVRDSVNVRRRIPWIDGGGVKTVCFAITVLALISILRGRERVEVAGRTIPQELVNRALAIFCLGVVVVMTVTLLLVLFENQPALFIDHLYESTSAFGTVGVSTGITASLTDASKTVIVATMFIGRVGPLTLLIALGGRHRGARYEFPAERVTLG